MPPIRPQLRKQPPKRAVKKVEDFRETSLGESFVMADIASAFRKLKTGLLQKLDDFTLRGDSIIEDVRTKADEQLRNARNRFDRETAIMNGQTHVTRQKIEKEVGLEIEKTSSVIPEMTKSFVKNFFKEITEEFTQNKSEVQQAIDHALTIKEGAKGDAGLPGIDGDHGKDATLTIKEFKALFKALPEGFLQIENIKDLERQLRDLSSKAGAAIKFGGAGGGQGSWKQKVLLGDINGANTVFTYAGEGAAEFSERVFLNYIEQNPFTDYTISGNTVTYTVAPDASLSSFPHIIRYQ